MDKGIIKQGVLLIGEQKPGVEDEDKQDNPLHSSFNATSLMSMLND